MDKFSKRRASIRDLQRQLRIKNEKKTPQELGEHEKFEDDPRALLLAIAFLHGDHCLVSLEVLTVLIVDTRQFEDCFEDRLHEPRL